MDRQRHTNPRPAGSTPGWFLALALAAVALSGCGTQVATPSATIASPAIPAAASTIVGSFVDQIDGRWGYAALRPAAWTPAPGPNQGRAYFSPAGPAEGGLILLVHNLAVEDHGASASVQWELFQADPTLAGWTVGLERSMSSDRVQYTVLERSATATIYATVTTGRLALNAYIVDNGQPLTMALLANARRGNLDPLDRLQANGLLADFAAMVASVRAVPQDPANVSPVLD